MPRSLRPPGRSPLHPLVLAAAVLLACGTGSDSVVGTDAPEPLFKPSCPGHPSCQDPPAPAGDATLDASGAVSTVTTQALIISKDSKNFFEGQGGGVENTLVDRLSYLTAAGSPTAAALGSCYTDPADLAATDPAATQRLIDRLDDDPQLRTLRFTVDKRDPAHLTGKVINTWDDDGDGHQYRTWLVGDPTVTIPSPDVYVYSGGTIRSWDTSVGISLFCPNLSGTVTLIVHR